LCCRRRTVRRSRCWPASGVLWWLARRCVIFGRSRGGSPAPGIPGRRWSRLLRRVRNGTTGAFARRWRICGVRARSSARCELMGLPGCPGGRGRGGRLYRGRGPPAGLVACLCQWPKAHREELRRRCQDGKRIRRKRMCAVAEPRGVHVGRRVTRMWRMPVGRHEGCCRRFRGFSERIHGSNFMLVATKRIGGAG
jgi:hypothetical protein